MNNVGPEGPSIKEKIHELIDIQHRIDVYHKKISDLRASQQALVHELITEDDIPEQSVIWHDGRLYLLEADIEDALFIHISAVQNLGA